MTLQTHIANARRIAEEARGITAKASEEFGFSIVDGFHSSGSEELDIHFLVGKAHHLYSCQPADDEAFIIYARKHLPYLATQLEAALRVIEVMERQTDITPASPLYEQYKTDCLKAWEGET